MKKITFEISGPALIRPTNYSDQRGFFRETFRQDWFNENIQEVKFVQDNFSFSSRRGTLRGLHFQIPPHGQGKLINCIKGKIFDVAVDIRPNSPTFKKWVGAELTEENASQLWVPKGFAHGFCTLCDDCIVTYKVSNYFSAEHDRVIKFDDASIGIAWPIDLKDVILSDKDKIAPQLCHYLDNNMIQ